MTEPDPLHPSHRHARARPLRALWHLMLPLLWVAAATAAVLGLAATGVWWLLKSEGGTIWLLDRAPGIHATGVRGALLSDHWEVDRLVIDLDTGIKAVVIEGAVASGLRWSWVGGSGGVWGAVHAASVRARSVELPLNDRPRPPSSPPLSIGSPLQAVIDEIEVGRFTIGTLAPALNVKGRGTVSAEGGTLHRLDAVAFDWERVRIEGQVQIGTHRPLMLDARATMAPRETGPAGDTGAWTASAVARGPLERFAATATLRGASPREGRSPPALDLTATIASFAHWPVATLQARTTALDLSSFSEALPATGLAGTVDVQATGLEAPMQFVARLDNDRAGRWDQRRLPLRHVDAQLRADLRHRGALDIGSFDIALAGAAGQDAGHWRGSGRWSGDALQLQTTLAGVRPQLVDVRALAAQVSGTLDLTISGLPFPGSAAAATKAPVTVDLRGELDGRLDVRPVPLKLQLDTRLSEERLMVRQLRAAAGAAVAQLSGEAVRAAGGRWQVKTEGSLVDVDPVLWWPGEEGPAGAAWRQGPHRLTAGWQLDVQLPADAARLPPLQLAQRVAGIGTVRLHESLLAGVPVQGEVTLGYRSGGNAPGQLRAELRAAGSRLVVDGRGDPLGPGLQDRYHGELSVDSLAALAPLLKLVPDAADWAGAEGRAAVTLDAEGRWPDVRSHGSATAQQLQAQGTTLARARFDWRFDTGADQPLAGTLDVSGLRSGGWTMDALKAELQGTAREHRITLDAELPLRPPAWTEDLLGLRPGPGTRTRLRGQGAWQADGAGGGNWRGVVDELLVGASGEAARRASALPGEWLDARGLRTELRFVPAGGLRELRAEAGQARIARELQLRWDAIRVDLGGARPDFEIRAQVDPFQAAPMLARMQPTMGWGGDLLLKARLNIAAAAQRFSADVAFERDRGDLSIDDPSGRQSLGLQSLQLALTADDGRWNLVEQLSGRILGDIRGEQQLRTAPGQRWPDARTPLTGRVEARVGNLGIWSAWVPPGWRLGGSLVTQATIGGRVGAPEYIGRAEGRDIAVRNLLLGVDVSDGQLDVSLQGERATIDRLTLKGGEGRLEMSGRAEFGAAPVARLSARAQRFRVLGRADRHVVASGNATVELRADALVVDGSVAVDEGLFDVSRSDAPSLDEDVVIRDARSPRREADTAEAGKAAPRRAVQLNATVDLGDKLRVRGRGLDTRLGGQLRITTPGGRLAITGLVRAEGGTYAAYAQKLDIDRGNLVFSGPPENPALDILALRPNLDARVGVAITGTFVNPRVRLYSDPEMSETDKLSWLVLGRPSDGLGRADTALLQRAAVALLSGEGEAPTDTLMRTLGLDELTLRQSDGEVRETVISLGKQLSRRWYVGYERSVNATTGTWQLIYRIAQRFTLRAQSGQENSLDVIWTWRVGESDKP
ncbi:MAG: translocation/assembly module TamB domain-containing protein [Rubrivivax sp.]|nr:translocation/assembly module TamB domain-containing protein [Rubrivivax sp.]